MIDVTITKLVKSLIKVDKDSFTASAEGAEFEVKAAYKGNGVFLTPNVDWVSVVSMDYKKGVPSKIVPNPADTAIVVLRVAPNEGAKNRVGTIIFNSSSSDGSSDVTVTVSQTGSVTPATVAEVAAAADDPNTLYRVQGYISSVNNLAKGRFNIKDFSGELYAFNIAAEPGGSTDLSAVVGEGDVVTIVGYKTSYNGTNEVVGYLESYYHVEAVTVAQFLAADDAADVWYRISGVVTDGSGKTEEGVTKKFDLENYGNFDLVDETGSVYVYGVRTGLNGETKKFGTLGVKEGDLITIVAAKKTYKDLVEADPTWYVSHQPADNPEPEPETNVYFKETFAEGQGAFTVDNVTIPEDLTYVWNFDSKNSCMKASGYKGQAFETESWLISPEIDLSEATAVTLSFEQALNYLREDKYDDDCQLWVINGEEKVQITIPEEQRPAGNKWDFVSNSLDLSAFAGKKVKVAFVFKSTTTNSATWEIKNVKVQETPAD